LMLKFIHHNSEELTILKVPFIRSI
jgi:hypothetical protein